MTSALPVPDIVLRPEPLDSPIARTLIAELDAELTERYPEPGANHFELPAADEFLVAWQSADDGPDRPVGCGALRVIDDGIGELKRMYVRAEARGRRVGSVILSELEAAALARGLHRLVLETGTRQTEAMALYRRNGFAEAPCWGAYAASPLSTCLAKPLG